jgi:Uma2 family endonuclease
MQTAAKHDFVSVEDYLAAEAASDVRHEYLGGLVYAMAGETTDHNQIVGNLYFAIRQHLKRKDEYFYYPGVVVTCDRRDNDKRFVRHPRLIIEVLSESTQRVDKREKFFAYTSIASLEEYVLVEQAAREVTVFRRADGWKATHVSGAKAKLPLKSLRLSLPLSTVYESV